MDTELKKDRLGNDLKVGDRVATAMVARTSGSGLRIGTVVDRGYSRVQIKTEFSSLVWRDCAEVVKVAD